MRTNYRLEDAKKNVAKATTAIDLRARKFSTFRKGSLFACLRILSLVVLDSVLIGLGWQVSNRLGTPMVSPWRLEINPYATLPVICILVGAIAARGLYASGQHRRDYRGLFEAVAIGNAVLMVVGYFYAPEQFVSRSHLLIFFLLSVILTAFSHFFVDFTLRLLRQKGAISYSVFLIADVEDEARAVGLIDRENRYVIQGIADACSLDRDRRAATFRRIKQLNISEVFVSWNAISRRLFLIWHFQSSGITLRVIPTENKPFFEGARFWMIGGLPSLSFDPPTLTGINFKTKKVMDYGCSLLILILAAPLYLAIALLIKLDSPGPVFYGQTRIGLHGKPFTAWKFRSMVIEADKQQQSLEALNKTKDGILFKIEDDPRVTRVGRVIRKYSLDELPQLFNVLLGEMSLVGPRPLPVRDVQQFLEHHFIRHEVLPGITGLWQVSGRSDIDDFEDVLRLDLDYIERWSLWLDFTILLRTVLVIFRKSGAY